MAVSNRGLLRPVSALMFELPAKRIGIDRLIERLERSLTPLEKRAAAVTGRLHNRRILAHMIGIERWSQRRMRVVFGEPLIDDEYEHYLPDAQDYSSLQETFRSTRQATIRLSKSLRMAGIDLSTSIEHNQYGTITLLGWLLYVDLHARWEGFHLY